MESRILKWGNSDAIRIPKPLLKELKLSTNDAINIVRDGDKIVITKVSKKNLSIEELFKDFTPQKIKEYDWGEPVGNEIW